MVINGVNISLTFMSAVLLSIITYITVLILAGNGIIFSMAVGSGYICPAPSNRVCNEGERVSTYSPYQSLTLFGGNSSKHCCQINIVTSIMFADSLLLCIIVVELFSTDLNSPILKGWIRASRAQCSLTAGIVRRQFPSLRGTLWRSNGSSTRNGSRFGHDIRILSGKYIHEVKLKMSCYNRE